MNKIDLLTASMEDLVKHVEEVTNNNLTVGMWDLQKIILNVARAQYELRESFNGHTHDLDVVTSGPY